MTKLDRNSKEFKDLVEEAKEARALANGLFNACRVKASTMEEGPFRELCNKRDEARVKANELERRLSDAMGRFEKPKHISSYRPDRD